MPLLHRRRGAEHVHVGRAGGVTIEASLDAVAFRFYLGVGEVDFAGNAGDVEATDIANAAVVIGFKVGADRAEAVGKGKGEEVECKKGEGRSMVGDVSKDEGKVSMLLILLQRSLERKMDARTSLRVTISVIEHGGQSKLQAGP